MINSAVPSIDIVAQQAIDNLLQSGNHDPFLFIYTQSESMVAPLSFIPETSDAKGMIMQMLAQEARKHSESNILTDVFMVTEAWMLNTEKSDDLGERRISEHPDRVEILAITHLDVRYSKAWMRIYEMKRDSRGELVEIVAHTAGNGLQEVRSYLLESFVAGWNATPIL